MGSHAISPSPMPLGDCSNLASPLIPTQRTRKWTKLFHDSNEENKATSILMDFDRRPGLESSDEQGGKRQCMDVCDLEDKENFQVVVGFQHHRQQ